jgi:leucyl aminopeptidase
MKFELFDGTLHEIETDAIIVPVGTNTTLTTQGEALDTATNGAFRKALETVGFTGKLATTTTIPTWGQLPATRIIAAGLGNLDAASPDAIRRAWGAASRTARNSGATTVASASPPESTGAEGLRAAAEGASLGLYRHLAYKTINRPKTELESVTFVTNLSGAELALTRAEHLASGIAVARDLVNEPGGSLYPERLAGRAWEIADEFGLDCTVYDRAALEEMGAGGIVGVGKGSIREPRLIHLVYQPEGESRGTIGLIGKAITFDTGGVNLKPAAGMRDMKIDMAGGAAVIGAMRSIAQLKLPFTVHGIVAAAENMPSNSSYRPGDVLRTLSGKTVEVTNTDAEGRIVLADAMTFANKHGVELMVDLATLTGASVVAVGNDASSLFANDDALAEEITNAAAISGERMWRMPLWSHYRSDLNSDIADIKNSGNRDAGAIKAALFLSEFTEETPWAHLDIAGPAWSRKRSGHVVKGGTGYGVHTLITMIEARARD